MHCPAGLYVFVAHHRTDRVVLKGVPHHRKTLPDHVLGDAVFRLKDFDE